MDLEWEARPYPYSDWRDVPQPATFAPSPPQSAFASTSSGLSQRRRSSAAHVRPAGPPPNLPIPSVPGPSPNGLQAQTSIFNPSDDAPHINGRGIWSTLNNNGLGTSPNHSVASAFPQTRHPASTSQPVEIYSTMDDLSDPPPQSFLPSTSTSSRERHGVGPSERFLHPPSTEQRSEQRPSSRRALTRALELAREAVQLDSTNDNPEAAVSAYAQSVALLSEVMERVRRGEDSNDSRRRQRRRSVAAQEEEVRRLQNIHDTYADRMNILSLIYSIPAVPYSTTSTYSTPTLSANSTTSNSPTNSTSPSSDTSPQIPQSTYTTNYIQEESASQTNDYDTHGRDDPYFPIVDSAVYTLDESVLSGAAISGLPFTSPHPYAVQYDQPPEGSARTPIMVRRARASSILPPAPPPPMGLLPPAPAPVANEYHSEPSRRQDVQTRQQTELSSPRASASGLSASGLAALEEEADGSGRESADRTDGRMPDTPRNPKRNSHPLPPLPSPPPASTDFPGTSKITLPISKSPSSSRTSNHVVARPRGSSQLTTRFELSNQSHIINSTTNQGTIHQRRTKTSAPPSTRSASPAESIGSAGSIPQQKSVSFPGSSASSVVTGRSRSSSQPGRRPSLIGGRISPIDQRPPLPGNTGPLNGANGRKASFPSKLAAPLPILQLDPASANPLLPPSTFPGTLPTTPTSLLPPAPPSDPLLKPYHMMNLLHNTMSSTTGGYVTRRLHVPCEVWSQGGAKLANVAEKVRVVAILCSALEDLQNSSSDYFGAGNVSSGLAMGIGSIGRKEADSWHARLEDFSNICDGVVANFGKKLGVGEGFVLKKTTWGDKLTRRFDKFTNGKNLDSPAAYVQGLKRLFSYAELLDEHTRAVFSQPVAPAYAAFPVGVRTAAEQKLKRSSEFFATVVLTFVIRDLSQLLDKYAKKCEKWLAE